MKKHIAVALVCLACAGLCRSTLAQENTAQAVLTRMEGNYAGLNSVALTGRVVTDIDTSGGKSPPAAAATNQLTYDAGQPGSLTTFAIRLAKPGFYHIEWSQPITDSYTQKGAAWNSGNGDFILLAGKKRSVEGGMDMALASATGVSGGVASTLPPLFFGHQTNEIASLKNLVLLPDETIDSNVCYVVSGDMKGIQLKLWITKDYWLKQKKMILGGEIKLPETSDDDMAKALKATGQEATPEAIAKMREMMKSAMAMTAKMKGSVTEYYETSEVNPPLKPESFEAQ